MTIMHFANGRTASHVLITDSGKVHYAADARTRPYHVLACNGRAMQGAGWGIKDLVADADWCASCRRLEVTGIEEPIIEPEPEGPATIADFALAVEHAAHVQAGDGRLF